MIRINDLHAVKLIAQQAHVRFVAKTDHCIAQYNSNDVIMGGCLFTDWNGGSIQLHLALWGGFGAMRPLIYLSFQYPFVQLGLKKIFGLVPEWNWKARNLDLRLGFKLEYTVDQVFATPEGVPSGLHILSMRREDCRWLNMKCPPIEYTSAMFTDPVNSPLRDMPTIGGVT
jgi:RimJ/RimL family protein N-acetyltransferase